MSTSVHTGDVYRETVAGALADGWRFASLHATTVADRPVIRTVLSSPEGDLRHEAVAA